VLVLPLSVTTTLTSPVNDSTGFVQVRLRPPGATTTPVHACPPTVTVAPAHKIARVICAQQARVTRMESSTSYGYRRLLAINNVWR